MTTAPREAAKAPPWHALPVPAALDALATSERGLSTAEAARRLSEHGPNRLRISPPASAWRILVAQFRSVVVGLLGAATLVSAATGDYPDAIAITAVLALNAALGFATELRARRAWRPFAR